jgi:hypothetical protein
MLLSALLALLSAPAQAACDARAIQASMKDAPPNTVASAFVELVTCDAAAAKKLAPAVVPTFIAGDQGNAGALAALQVGAPDATAAWLSKLQSDERAPAIAALGAKCNDVAPVQDFFVASATRMGEAFWKERWYRGLAMCKGQAAQELLWAELSKGPGADETRFLALLETYARSAGGAAVPRLEELLGRDLTEPQQMAIVGAFPDAAQVGSAAGTDEKARVESIAAIQRVAPRLKKRAVEQARTTLTALGEEAAANALVKLRYKDQLQADGSLLWGAIVVEDATCKNGKAAQRQHVAEVRQKANLWPDAVPAAITGRTSAWPKDLAEKCKGTGAHKQYTPEEPFADKAAFEAWVKTTLRAAAVEGVKPERVDQPGIEL